MEVVVGVAYDIQFVRLKLGIVVASLHITCAW